MAYTNGIAIDIECGQTINGLDTVGCIEATDSTCAFALSTMTNQGYVIPA